MSARGTIKAIYRNGSIQPLEPFPPTWKDGDELQVEQNETVASPSAEEVDRDFRALEDLCATNDPEDDERLMRAIQEARERAKEDMRRRTGRPE